MDEGVIMSYAKPRSANSELSAGMTDGKYRKAIMDRGGDVEHTFMDNRECLTDAWYGIHESPRMTRPDGVVCSNPYAVRTPEASPEAF